MSQQSSAEEAALLSGEPTNKQISRGKWDLWTKIGLGTWATVATIGFCLFAVLLARSPSTEPFPPDGKRNLVFMVSDGMGPTSLVLTRSYRQLVDGLPYTDTLTLDKYFVGTSRTRSTSSLVTDSAAGATAFSCALKSYNNAISVLPGGSPCGTVLEAAKQAGYMTGLVVTTRITDATPACFSAHVNHRSEEDRIAEQQIGDYPLGRVVDLMLGGGRCHFLPNATKGSCRGDSRNLVKEAQSRFGFSYIEDRESFDALQKGNNVKLPLLGLFAPTDIPFDIDRKDEDYPSLEEMAEVALTALERATRGSHKGFFLMVEGSRIDHAGHGNDPAAQVREVLAYDRTFKRVAEWIEKSKDLGALVSTSDHETGGLAAARQLHATYPEYLWYPEVLANASSSTEYLSNEYAKFSGTPAEDAAFVRDTILVKGLGVLDASPSEVAKIQAQKASSAWTLADVISRRAQVGWTTHGHSGVDVNIYATTPAHPHLKGNHENTEVGDFLRDYLDVDVEAVTKKLRKKGVGPGQQGWMGRPLEEITDMEMDGLDGYHGDFKHRH